MSERETQDHVAVDEASAEGSVESQDKAAEPCEQAATEAQKEAAAESQETAAESQDEVADEADGLAELEAARAEAAANYDRYVRAVAELDNYRKRTVRMRAETRDEILRDICCKSRPSWTTCAAPFVRRPKKPSCSSRASN